MPKVALLEMESLPAESSETTGRQRLAGLLGLPLEQVPPVRIKWSHLRLDPQGELLAGCPFDAAQDRPKVPSDLEAGVGYHVDNKNPGKRELVFGYNHLRTTDRNEELELELPVGHSADLASANEGNHFREHRSKVALPFVSGQVQLGDCAYDHTDLYQWIRGQACPEPVEGEGPPSSTITPATKTAPLKPSWSEDTISTAPLMLPVDACVTLMATPTLPTAVNMSVACNVPHRSSSFAPMARRCGVTATECLSKNTHA